jgi:hypothetical protein
MLQVDAAMKDRWDTMAFHVFQNKGFTLQGTVMPPVDIDGNTFYFIKAGGVAEAQSYTVGDEVKQSTASLERIPLISNEWDYADRIFDKNRSKLSINEETVYHNHAGWSLGRRADKIIYEKFHALAPPASRIVGDFASAWDPAKALTACDALQDADVPWDGQIFCGLPSRAWNQMLTYQVFTNSQWTGPDLAFTKVTDRKTWNGVNWFLLPKHLQKKTGTNMSFYMWHQSAVGAGYNDSAGIRSEWEREVKRKAWWYQSTLDGAALVLQPEGVIECRMKADSAIALTAGL